METSSEKLDLNTRQGINWERAKALVERERHAFAEAMPTSRALSERAARHLLFGVPLHWMNDWSTPFSLYVEEARGAAFTDVDGHRYADFCLGDTARCSATRLPR
jgi:Glutamate-1-semialdehyde aminotransferase